MQIRLQSNKAKDAVLLFERFVNEAMKEGEKMNLLKGQVPNNKRPGEYHFLQYIFALQR